VSPNDENVYCVPCQHVTFPIIGRIESYMWQDIRLAIRRLAADKGFSITGTIILALGIGTSTGIFTLIHAVMIKSLPVADPQSIIRIGDGDNCCVLWGTSEPLLDLFVLAI